MRKLTLCLYSLAIMMIAVATIASEELRNTPRSHIADSRLSSVPTGQSVPTSNVRADTVYLMGGPNRDDGDFENANGDPDWEGWTSVDLTAPIEAHWHCDDYLCQNLDPTTLPNHAWWCGTFWPDDCGTQDFGGYGNDWLDQLDWYGSVQDNTLPTTVTVRAVLNYDIEAGYDFLYFGHETITAMIQDQVFSGTMESVIVDISFQMTPVDYVGVDQDQVHLRWWFVSDLALSDEDCLWPTLGAAQIDLIDVFFDQGGGPVQQGVTEDCEGENPPQWFVTLASGVGDYAKIWCFLQDIDPCRSNTSCVVAFIDDGVVVPGTGGFLCTTWCYGPGGYIVNPEGGLLGPEFHIENKIWSPLLTWPGDQYTGAALEFDVYRHEELAATAPGILYVWHVRSTDSVNPDDIYDTEWQDRNLFYYGGPDWLRVHRNNGLNDVTDLLVAGRQYLQLSLGVYERGWVWGFNGSDGYPAPYFDNVAFLCWDFLGPGMSTREIDIAQDNFPEIGTYDYGNLEANSIRFDAAFDVGLAENDPGDSITVDVVPVRTGAVLDDLPKLFYKVFPNPVFDPVRTFPTEGWIYGDTTYTAGGGVVADRYNFDIPDTGFFYPGDVIHYYIEGKDNVAGDIGTTLLPGDTTGFRGPPGYPHYNSSYRVQGLPTFFTMSPGDHPPILFLNDLANRGGEEEWYTAFQNTGYQQGEDFDVYYTNGPSSGVGNGIGGRATATQLMGYQTIIYTCGDLSIFTISNGDPQADKSNDVGVLDSWLRQGNASNPRNMFLTGDDLVFDLWVNGGAATLQFVSNWIGVNFMDQDVRPLIDNLATPTVQPLQGNSMNLTLYSWIAYGGCLGFNTFDAVTTTGSTEQVAQFLDPNGSTGQYPYTAMTLANNPTFNAKIVYCPYDLMFVYTDPDHPPADQAMAARSQLLNEVLLFFGHIGTSPATEVPEAGAFTVKSYPNPFNPNTKIEYSVPQRGKLMIKIYNLRGELVRTLIDEVVAAGDGFVTWDGNDVHGQTVASGVYFYETRCGDMAKVGKLALVK